MAGLTLAWRGIKIEKRFDLLFASSLSLPRVLALSSSSARTLRLCLGLLPILVLCTAATGSALLLLGKSAGSFESGVVRGGWVLSLCGLFVVLVTMIAIVGRWVLGEMERGGADRADLE